MRGLSGPEDGVGVNRRERLAHPADQSPLLVQTSQTPRAPVQVLRDLGRALQNILKLCFPQMTHGWPHRHERMDLVE